METPETLCNVFRIRRDGRSVEFSLGVSDLQQRDQKGKILAESVREIACGTFDVDLLHAITRNLVAEALRYQEETGEDIGFSSKKST